MFVKFRKLFSTDVFMGTNLILTTLIRVRTKKIMKSEIAYQDNLLVERIKNGDDSAYNDMVSRYWDRIFARVFNLLKNQQDAEEVTQDAFIRAHRGLKNFRGDSSFSTWLYQIATNLAHNRYWYWFRRKRDQSMSLDKPLTAEGDLTLQDVIPCKSENPFEATVTQEFVDQVSACMDGLSEKHREVLVLRNVKNLSYDAISKKLNISVGTVKSRIARARENLRELMGSDFS